MLTARHLPAVLAAAVATTALLAAPAAGDHSWNGYHWARQTNPATGTANPFTLGLGDNVTSAWDGYLATTSSDWSDSTVLDTTVVAGRTNSKSCRPTSGRVEVCNSTYGNTGWLGVAQIWASGSHIAQGVVKVNDTYFNTARYNTPAWRSFVMCQEVGHTLGLDHQDENFDNPNLGSCMDYTDNPSTNQHPNQHDYDQLELIYRHADDTTTVGSTTAARSPADPGNDPSQWGRAIRTSGDGRPSLYERDLGGGRRLFTFVIWAR